MWERSAGVRGGDMWERSAGVRGGDMWERSAGVRGGDMWERSAGVVTLCLTDHGVRYDCTQVVIGTAGPEKQNKLHDNSLEDY